MNIVIVDDDVCFSNKLKDDIKKYFYTLDDEVTVFTINNDYQSLLDHSSIDLLFLDVDLKVKYNGINLGAYVKSKFPKILLVFISSYDDFVFPALSIGFFQFIRKSKYNFDMPKVFSQIKKYLIENIKRVIIHINGRKYAIKLSEINYILSIGHDLFIKTIDDDFTITSSLKKFMHEIEFSELIQIERNYVINLNYIKTISKSRIITLDNEEHNVGRKYQDNLMQKYEDFLLR